MPILDIHTHHVSADPYSFIQNLSPLQNDMLRNVGYYSVGLHPWEISDGNEAVFQTVRNMAMNKKILAIGETGLDRLANCSLDNQMYVFHQHIALAESVHKPLIIHCVRASSEVISVKRADISATKWIIHGFRGKWELAKRFLEAGFFLSLGKFYNNEVMKQTPLCCLFFETDEAEINIEELYERAANIRNISVFELKSIIQENIHNVFFST